MSAVRPFCATGSKYLKVSVTWHQMVNLDLSPRGHGFDEVATVALDFP